MSGSFEKEQNRREFLTGLLRYTALALMAIITGLVVAKRRRLARDGICINKGICRGCSILEQCGLPLAMSQKQNLKETKNDRR